MMTGSEICPFSSVKSKRHNEEFSKNNDSDATILTEEKSCKKNHWLIVTGTFCGHMQLCSKMSHKLKCVLYQCCT